jgi:hypothetical protein
MHTKGDTQRSLLCCAHVNKHQSKYQETFGGSEKKFRNLKIPIMHSPFSLQKLQTTQHSCPNTSQRSKERIANIVKMP